MCNRFGTSACDSLLASDGKPCDACVPSFHSFLSKLFQASVSCARTHSICEYPSPQLCIRANMHASQARAVMESLVVDSRERGLIQCLVAKCVPHRVLFLPVGDVKCTYEDRGCSWILERKRADDFAVSIQDGRWREQSSRLFATGLRVFFVIEGDLRWLDGMYNPMWGAMVNANLRSSCLFRTWDVEETTTLVLHLEKKLHTYPPSSAVAAGLRPPQSKRQRESEASCVFTRQLMCVPTVSERIAVALVEHFGDLESLQDTLRDTRNFPRIQIGDQTFLGKARVATLAKHLLSGGAA